MDSLLEPVEGTEPCCRQPDEEAPGARLMGRAESFHSLSWHPAFPAPPCVQQTGNCADLPLQVFVEASLWLNEGCMIQICLSDEESEESFMDQLGKAGMHKHWQGKF